MRNRAGWVAVAAIIAFTASGCKPKLEGTVKGYKPGSSSIVLVHVKSDQDVAVTCSSKCLECNFPNRTVNGEQDIEVDLGGKNADKQPKQVCLRARKGLLQTSLDLRLDSAGGVPPKLELAGSGSYSITEPKAFGDIKLLPPSATLVAAAKTTLEVGTSKLTADEHGYASGPVTLTLSPGVNELPLTSICSETPSAIGSTSVTVTFPNAVKATGSMALTTEAVAHSLYEVFANMKQATLFPWEKPGASAPKKSRRAVLYPTRSSCFVRGPATAKLSDVHLVVVTKSAPERTGTCEYLLVDKESNERTGGASGKLTFHDKLATAYDRFTGKEVATQLIKAEKKCDPKFSDVGSTIPGQDSYADDKTVIAWAGSL